MQLPTAFHIMPCGRRIAYRRVHGDGPLLVFLPGYKSDMAGGKATALLAWAQRTGRAALLFDYSGCGASDGAFAEGTLSRWRDEAIALIGAEGERKVILIGSSMGGWLMLLVAEALGPRVSGLVGIAAAPDFTEWGFTEAQKAKLAAEQAVFADNPYGPEPTPTYPAFFADAQTHLRLTGAVALDGPVRLLHGQRDADVPPEISLRLAAALRSDDIQVTLIKDGDHRLSRAQDIALILRAAADLAGEIAT